MESSVPLCQAVGLDFFGSMVAACRAGRLSQRDARRFVTSFLEAEAKAKSMSSRPKRGTGQCGHRGLDTLLRTPNPWVGAPNTQPHLLPYLLSLASIGESEAEAGLLVLGWAGNQGQGQAWLSLL